MPDDAEPTHYTIRLRVAPDAAPGSIRLRRFLKMARRSYGLVAERVEALPAGGTALPDPNTKRTV